MLERVHSQQLLSPLDLWFFYYLHYFVQLSPAILFPFSHVSLQPFAETLNSCSNEKIEEADLKHSCRGHSFPFIPPFRATSPGRSKEQASLTPATPNTGFLKHWGFTRLCIFFLSLVGRGDLAKLWLKKIEFFTWLWQNIEAQTRTHTHTHTHSSSVSVVIVPACWPAGVS